MRLPNFVRTALNRISDNPSNEYFVFRPFLMRMGEIGDRLDSRSTNISQTAMFCWARIYRLAVLSYPELQVKTDLLNKLKEF
jgi:hypothetical protein